MKCEQQQRALFKQNFARAVQAAGLARHRPQPRENINAGDTTMVWRNNDLNYSSQFAHGSSLSPTGCAIHAHLVAGPGVNLRRVPTRSCQITLDQHHSHFHSTIRETDWTLANARELAGIVDNNAPIRRRH